MEAYYELLEVEQLIAEVKSRPVIWNSNLEEYNDRAKKSQAWQEVLRMCTTGWEGMSPFTKQEKAKEIQKRWKNVRDHYVRELKMIRGGVVRKKRKYIYFDRLSFLGSLHQNKITSTTPRFKSSLTFCEGSRKVVGGSPHEEDSNGDNSAAYDPFADVSCPEKSDSGEAEGVRDCEVIAVPSDNPEGSAAEATPSPPEEKGKGTKGGGRGKGAGNFKANLLDILRGSVACREEQSGDEERLFMLSLVSELKRVPTGRRLLVKTQIIQAILQGQQGRDSNPPR